MFKFYFNSTLEKVKLYCVKFTLCVNVKALLNLPFPDAVLPQYQTDHKPILSIDHP